MAKPRKKMGRPSKYSNKLARAICMRLMLGESLSSICKRDMYPSKVTVLSWLHTKTDFLNQYTKAREVQQEIRYDELFEIADDSSNDYVQTENGPRLNSEHVNRSRLRIDTRKWVMERMAAKKYGPKQGLEVTGSGGGPITSITFIDAEKHANSTD